MRGITWGGLLTAALVVAALTVRPDAGPARSGTPPRDVRVACKTAVAGRLLSPGSMRTLPVKDPTPVGVNRWEYGLVIDSQNAYGALIRSVWRCDYADRVATVTRLE